MKKILVTKNGTDDVRIIHRPISGDDGTVRFKRKRFVVSGKVPAPYDRVCDGVISL